MYLTCIIAVLTAFNTPPEYTLMKVRGYAYHEFEHSYLVDFSKGLDPSLVKGDYCSIAVNKKDCRKI